MCRNLNNEQPQSSCIRRVPIFQQLGDTEIDILQSVTYSRSYKKGNIIFREGESSDSLFVLNHGLIKISKVTEDGKEHILRFLFPGDFFGQFALLQDKKHYANAEVLDAAVVCQIHRDEFKPLLEQNPTMAYQFLLAVSERLQQADEWAGAFLLFEVEKRLAKMLLYLHQKDSPPKDWIYLPTAKRELAALIGTTPETLSRKLSHLESIHLIALEGRKIKIVDRDGLHHLAGD